MSDIIEIPNSWKAGVITNDGLGLLSKLVKGHTLNIIRAEIGAGWVDPEQLNTLKAVMEPMQALSFSTVSYPEEGKCVIPCKLDNSNVTESYIGRQIGLYAQDPDKGEILFYVTQVEDEDGGTGIPANNIIPSYSATWNLVIYYGMADGVDVTVDPASSVTHEEMEQFVEDALEGFQEDMRPATNEEIDAALGSYSGGEGGGDMGFTVPLDHTLLFNRDAEDQHPIESITGLEEALDKLEDMAEDDGGPVMTDGEIDDVWNNIMGEGV